MDRRCLELLREDGVGTATGITWSADTVMALLVTFRAPSGHAHRGRVRGNRLRDRRGRARHAARALLPARSTKAAVIDDVEIAVPGDRRRARELRRLREAVSRREPARGQRQAHDRRTHRQDRRRHDRPLRRALAAAGLLRRGVRAARSRRRRVGHVSDGNLHPNVIPRSLADVQSGKDALLAFGREVIRLGGSPLAEHGVGRNPVKQRLLSELDGPKGIDEMRAVKRAIDPGWKLAPGVLFPAR